MNYAEKMVAPQYHKKYSRRLRRLEKYQQLFRCPECASPTFYPYGEDPDDLRPVRRWLCKQCGYYVGPEGEQWALYDPVVDLTDTPLNTWGCWQLKKDASIWAYLPKELVAAYNEQCRKEAAAEPDGT